MHNNVNTNITQYCILFKRYFIRGYGYISRPSKNAPTGVLRRRFFAKTSENPVFWGFAVFSGIKTNETKERKNQNARNKLYCTICPQRQTAS